MGGERRGDDEKGEEREVGWVYLSRPDICQKHRKPPLCKINSTRVNLLLCEPAFGTVRVCIIYFFLVILSHVYQ